MTHVKRATLRQGIVQRSGAIGIPMRLSIPISKEIERWINSSGEEWTIDRIKAIKLDIIRQKAGLPPVSSWISKTSKGNFKGIFGSLQSWMLSKTSNFAKGIQLLQCYTLFYSKVVTDKQKEKFLTGVQSEPLSPECFSFAKRIIRKGWSLSGKIRLGNTEHPPPLEMFVPRPNKRAPLPDRSVDESLGVIDSLRFLYESKAGDKHLGRFYQSHYKHLVKNCKRFVYSSGSMSIFKKNYSYRKDLLAGRIGLIQEPGYKLRAVANPGRVFQLVLKPLGDKIYSCLKTLPWDSTFNQVKSFPVLQSHLALGKTIHSIDLTGATDYFPIELQEYLLKLMTDAKTVDLFTELSKSSWYFPNLGEVRWTRGQPLGLYPSFGAFALTHGILLLGLLNRPYNNDFFILGDDVVILDDQLAQDYFQALIILGCPVAMHKSISSSILCEFGGKIITSSVIIPQLKWRDVSDESFLDIARLLGPRSLPLFKPRQSKVIKEISFVPDFLGGLGWNPKGLPLEDRIYPSWIYLEKLPVDHLMGYSNVIVRNLMVSELFQSDILDTVEKGIIDMSLEQRASSIVVKTLGRSFKNFPINLLGKNVDYVNSFILETITDLPINPGEGNSLRPSLLDSWEAKLKRLK